MNWEQLCGDKKLEGIPCRIEIVGSDQLLLSPRQSYHSVYQSRIIRSLNRLLPDGEAIPECPIPDLAANITIVQ